MPTDELVQRFVDWARGYEIQRLVDWAHGHETFLYIVVGLVVGYVVGRYRAFRSSAYQNRGEALVARVLKSRLRGPDYHLMNHVTLQLKDGTTEIDHILVSRFGVFVVETKTYKGWIFADASQPKWTQVLLKARFRFQNPIFQNRRHVRAVQSVLDFLPPTAIKSVVVFTGQVEFKTDVPQGVVYISELVDYLRAHTVEELSRNRMQFCVGRLETARLAISGRTDVEHVQSLERRHGSVVRY